MLERRITNFRKAMLSNGNMKNKIYFIIFGLSIFSAQFLSCQKVFADDTATSTTSDGALATSTQVFNIEVSVDVPANCVATDTDGIVHTYEASSSSSYLGICAL